MDVWIAGPPEVTEAAQPEAQEDASAIAEVAEQSTTRWLLCQFQRIWERIALYKATSTRVQLEGIDLSLTAFGARRQPPNHDVLGQQGSSLDPLQSAFLSIQQQQQQQQQRPSSGTAVTVGQEPQQTYEAIALSSTHPMGAAPSAATTTAHPATSGHEPALRSPTQEPMLRSQDRPGSTASKPLEIVPALQSAEPAEHRKVHRRYGQPLEDPPPPEGLAGSSRKPQNVAAQVPLPCTSSEAALLAAIAANLQLKRHKHIVMRQWGLACSIQVQPPSWLAGEVLPSERSNVSVVSISGTPEVPVSPDSRAASALAAQDSFSITDDNKGMRDTRSPKMDSAGGSFTLKFSPE